MSDTKSDGEWNLHDQLTDRDLACQFLTGLDYDSQLRAIGALLEAHKERDAALISEIEKADADARRLSGMRHEQAVEHWVEHLHNSTYQDAAHSMAAVGMIAPFIESVFHQGFLGIEAHLGGNTRPPMQHESNRRSTPTFT